MTAETATAPDRAPERPGEDPQFRGTNQSGMRAQNERLVLTLLRQMGALAKSDIARMTGLSAQTVSVMMRRLEGDGLLQRGEPQRGQIGQPSIPMSLAAGGAYFFGLKIGRRSADLVLIDFLGQIVGMRRRLHRYPTPDGAVAFVREALPDLAATLPPGGPAGSAALASPCPSSSGTGSMRWARRRTRWTTGATATSRPIWPR